MFTDDAAAAPTDDYMKREGGTVLPYRENHRLSKFPAVSMNFLFAGLPF